MLYRVEAELGLVYPLHMKDDYDIEVAYLEFGPTKVIASSTNKKTKKIAWVHCDFEIAIPDKKAFIEKAASQYKKFDKIACVSEKCKESFVSMFGNDPEVVVIHNVIDDKEILDKANQPLKGVHKRRFTLCTVGRLSAPKNYIRLLKTAYKLHGDDFDFDLLFELLNSSIICINLIIFFLRNNEIFFFFSFEIKVNDFKSLVAFVS